jgi:hypothetical protein
MALLPLERKSYSGFLSPLKISRPQPGLNPRALGPMESTITVTPPRTTASFVGKSVASNKNLGVYKFCYADNMCTVGKYVRFQVLTATSMKFRVFWDILPCSHQGPDDGGSTHLWNVGRHRFDYTAVYPRRLWVSVGKYFKWDERTDGRSCRLQFLSVTKKV